MKPHKSTPFRFHHSLLATAAVAMVVTHFTASSAFALTYYWDTNGTTAGFGTAGGTWAAPTIGDATQGWSQDLTGATEPINVTVAGTNGTTDGVNFGTDVAGRGLAAGTVTVSGTVSSGNMTIGSQSGAITLSGGQINFHTQTAGAIITSNNAGMNVIQSTIGSSSAGSALIISDGTVKLTANNTFNRPIRIGAGGVLRFSTVGNVGAGASNLGAPSDAARGLIQIGIASNSATLLFHDATAAQSTDRQVRIGDNANGSGSSAITNNNADVAHTLTFTNTAFNVATTGTASSFSRTLTLNGVNTGDNTIQGTIVNNGASRVAVTKSGAGTWILNGENTYSNNTTVTAGILVLGNSLALQNSVLNTTGSVVGDANNGFRTTVTSLTIGGLSGDKDLATVFTTTSGGYDSVTALTLNTVLGRSYSAGIADGALGMTLTKTGSNSQTLSGTNTYTGATFVSGGTLIATTTAAYPGYDTIGKFTINGGSLGARVGGAGWTTAEVDTLLANATKTSGALGIDTTNGDVTQWTAFSTTNFGPSLGLTKLGENILTLDQVNNYTGATTISAGTLLAGAAAGGQAFGNLSAVTVANFAGATLDLNGFDQTIGSLAGGGTTGGNVTMGSATLTTGGNGSSTIYTGVISGTGGLIKVGAGNQTLRGANIYTGTTTISGGTLTIGASNVLDDTTAVSLGAATLGIGAGFADTVGTLDVTGAATINLGSATSVLTFANSSAIDWSGGTLNLTGTFVPGVSLKFGIGGLTGAQLSSITSSGWTAFALDGSGFLTATEVTGSPYETWAGTALFGADDNGDGVSNGLAFLLGAANPTESALNKLPIVTQTGGNLVLSFSMRNSTARGTATLTLQHSSDLGITDPWTSVAILNGGPFSGVTFAVTPGDPLDTVVATINASEAVGGKLFGRLEGNNP